MLWTHCRSQAPGSTGRKGVRSGPGELESGEIQKMKNSGNEAKKYLKTKDLTFFNTANFARFVNISA
jgi:hypothetical protein